ncbi:TonB-dependent receptor domain-containing protein [Flagellimonas okinawensis]|uniref:TonB-dependent receptor n=1 Tax=Flagellimonas okinawensis TaxID=3031324 RepID=A0ABT5XMT0_9FLAO|nr:TonB-dependent receptor [[Muricauda] okinawensis]MDF0707192.1 TonB-dependent receptor [[Muricauda] okinawensis]
MNKSAMAKLCVLLFGTTLSYAQITTVQDSLIKKPVQLDEVLVEGKKMSDPVFSAYKSEPEKKVFQSKNVADLFKGINGFNLIKRGNYAIDPSFRASQYEQLNVQFNGGTKVMHACPNRMDPITTHVIPEEIERVEVVKGPYTFRYGPTFGGIVNLVTQEVEKQDKGYHGKVNFGGENNGNAITSFANVKYVGEQFDANLNFGFRDFGNYEDGDGNEVPSSFRSTDYGLQVGYNPTDDQRIQLGFRQSFGRDVLHAGLPMDTEIDDSNVLSLDYKLDNISDGLKTLSAKLYRSKVDHVMTNELRPSFMMVEAVSEVDATTLGGRVELEWRPVDQFKLYTGIDAFSVARTGNRNRLVKRNMMTGEPLPMPMEFEDEVWQDSQIDDFGAFVEGKYPLSDKFLLNVGFRYDLVRSTINAPADDFVAEYPELDSRTENNLSATASIKYMVSSNLLLELAYGRGVRSANMIERFINHFTVGQDPYEYVGNPFLDAEVNNQFELGIKANANFEGYAINRLDYGASVFYSLYDNYIVAVIDPSLNKKYMPMVEPTEVKRFINLDEAYKTGFELYGELAFLKDFAFKTELSYVYTKNQDLDESLPLTPPLVTRFNLSFEQEKIWARATYTLTSEQSDIAPSFGERTTDGYGVMDLSFGVRPFQHLTVGVAASNIFDETYNNHLNFSFVNQADYGRVPINDPGRNLSAFIQYSF